MNRVDRHFAEHPPVVIIAAPRSGTKLLRNLLAKSRALGGDPYDINYVWLYGAYHLSHDERDPAGLSPRMSRFIRTHIHRAAAGKAPLEKTVSNGLRVPFVRAVLPEARFVHLIRDGRDVTASLFELWQLPQSSRRNQSRRAMLAKLLKFPFVRAWPYLVRNVTERVLRKLGLRKALPVWGPRYKGIKQDVDEKPLIEVCATQWVRCEDRAAADLADSDHITVRYEDLISDPEATLTRIGTWLDLPDTAELAQAAKAKVRSGAVGSWQDRLDETEQTAALTVLGPTLRRLGYIE